MATEASVAERIRAEVESNDIVLYMKGTPVFPQCGFSAQAVQILGILGAKFKGVDVLADPGLRQGIKDFSNWPTIPSFTSRENSSAAATSCARCMKYAETVAKGLADPLDGGGARWILNARAGNTCGPWSVFSLLSACAGYSGSFCSQVWRPCRK